LTVAVLFIVGIVGCIAGGTATSALVRRTEKSKHKEIR
jgi:hypothetical protein